MKRFLDNVRNRVFFAADIFSILVAYAVTVGLMFTVVDFLEHYTEILPFVGVSIVVFLLSFYVFDVYKVYWVYASTNEYLKLVFAALSAAIVCIIANIFIVFGQVAYPKFNIAANFVAAICTVSVRFGLKVLYKIYFKPDHSKGKRVLIIGAGRMSSMLLREIRDDARLNYRVVGLIDDDKKLHSRMMSGTKVLGGRESIIKICKAKSVEKIIFAIYTITQKDKREILEICAKTGCPVMMMPSTKDALTDGASIKSMRNIEIEDLLERDPIVLDNNLIEHDISGKTILVTGGGGSIGSELCRQIVKFQPKKLVILDIYENTAYELENELKAQYPEQDISVLIASIRDNRRLDEIFESFKPDMVFHAAAHKHVPLMEFSPAEAVKNNVFGTLNVVRSAEKYRVKRFIMISTDKAVNPTNVMGATKRMCELIVQTAERNCHTEFVAVRFGNVLGSNGSVIPHFKKQIKSGGPVTVTHPEITRYFMTIPEAARLVLQAAAYAKGGEIFVLDMGKPVKIRDLAEKMITLAGFTPNVDIKIEYTGLRPGEKLYEELLMNEEGLKETEHEKIFIGKPTKLTADELVEKLKILEAALDKGNDAIKAALEEVIPTYVPPEKLTKEQIERNKPVEDTEEPALEEPKEETVETTEETIEA